MGGGGKRQGHAMRFGRFVEMRTLFFFKRIFTAIVLRQFILHREEEEEEQRRHVQRKDANTKMER